MSLRKCGSELGPRVEQSEPVADQLFGGHHENRQRQSADGAEHAAQAGSDDDPYKYVDERNQHHPRKNDECNRVEHGIPRCGVPPELNQADSEAESGALA